MKYGLILFPLSCLKYTCYLKRHETLKSSLNSSSGYLDIKGNAFMKGYKYSAALNYVATDIQKS